MLGGIARDRNKSSGLGIPLVRIMKYFYAPANIEVYMRKLNSVSGRIQPS